MYSVEQTSVGGIGLGESALLVAPFHAMRT